MQIHNSLNEIPKIDNLVLTIGTFDGVHLGHKKLIESINQKAKEVNGASGLLTFHPHPRMVIRKEGQEPIQLLTTIEERIELLKKTGLDHLFIVPFSRDFASQPPREYVEDILLGKLNAKHLVIGYDHRFGKNRAGNIELLKEMSTTHDFSVQQIDQQKIDEITYSSTTIRNFLLAGDVNQANELLGYEYFVDGIVVHGHKRGRDLGYPTANIEVNNTYKLIPGKSVYAIQTIFGEKKYGGMLNIGTRPTFDGQRKTIENVLFDFTGNLYGHKLRTVFVEKIRSEHKFASAEELKAQLTRDEDLARTILELR